MSAQLPGAIGVSKLSVYDTTAPARAGAQRRIGCFQVADWITPLPKGVLLGRRHERPATVGRRA